MRLTKNPLKKLLFAYLLATLLVLVYFISRHIFQEEKTIEYKSFDTPSDKSIIQPPAAEEEKQEKTRFMLLPTK